MFIEESLQFLEQTQLYHDVWVFGCVAELFAKILLRSFASVFISDIYLCFLHLVLVSERWWTHRMNLEVFLPLRFFERVLG